MDIKIIVNADDVPDLLINDDPECGKSVGYGSYVASEVASAVGWSKELEKEFLEIACIISPKNKWKILDALVHAWVVGKSSGNCLHKKI